MIEEKLEKMAPAFGCFSAGVPLSGIGHESGH